ncbi:conserved hypothetical protein [Gluconacetobacter diazotrophicus PA1 5]|uniref:PD-(D/E)XK nuclease-like domain-containing protein n=1 Tax=Gluconacetobacter diazotrophicus TaxID=33996 RepID=UPI000173DC22|nr:PD-(D/E)XK nuclease-like domain-containing protein [Gluconacetobacter diazotrophicus]ACI52234.1 conserved hypothetical protein [Gluconacetobacter diazotrophicus PA1 5]
MTLITKPGIYDMPERDYHADPCPAPSLSNSVARVLLDESPMHARHAHPRLNADRAETEVTETMRMGTALHSLLLGKGARVIEVKFDDYRKGAAKEVKDAAEESGLVPLLSKNFDAIHKVSECALAQMRAHPDLGEFFGPGQSEAVIAWQEDGIWCRGMVDRLPADLSAPAFDLKGTMLSASPTQWDRRMVSAYRTQDRFYARGLRAIEGRWRPAMRFIIVEMKAPYAISVMTPAPSLQELATVDVERAIAGWKSCMQSGEWPGYPHTAHIEAPAWLLRAHEEQQMRDDALEFAQ